VFTEELRCLLLICYGVEVDDGCSIIDGSMTEINGITGVLPASYSVQYPVSVVPLWSLTSMGNLHARSYPCSNLGSSLCVNLR
jgi:hypothetical protein